jgi:hypothetical protein
MVANGTSSVKTTIATLGGGRAAPVSSVLVIVLGFLATAELRRAQAQLSSGQLPSDRPPARDWTRSRLA